MMPSGELILAAALVLVIWGVAATFGWRQLRQYRKAGVGPNAESSRRSAGRRLFVTIVLAVCGGLIALPYLTGLADQVAKMVPAGDDLSPEQRHALQLYAGYWIAVGLLLVLALCVIAFDLKKVSGTFSKKGS